MKDFVVLEAVEKCRHCDARKRKLTLITRCRVNGVHDWEMRYHEIKPILSNGWWLMALFSWDALFARQED